ncbi:MAG: PIN domain-containing protein [Bryobacteraceae bacterium]
MEKALLDTDILSEYLKGYDQTVVNRAASYARQHRVFTFTSVTVYEVVYGLELKAAASQLRKALAWLSQNDQITPTNADYVAAATIKATARKQGSILERPDCLIAAIAVRLQMPLVTGNVGDFGAIQKTGIELTIENWSSRRSPLRRATSTTPSSPRGRTPTRICRC